MERQEEEFSDMFISVVGDDICIAIGDVKYYLTPLDTRMLIDLLTQILAEQEVIEEE